MLLDDCCYLCSVDTNWCLSLLSKCFSRPSSYLFDLDILLKVVLYQLCDPMLFDDKGQTSSLWSKFLFSSLLYVKFRFWWLASLSMTRVERMNIKINTVNKLLLINSSDKEYELWTIKSFFSEKLTYDYFGLSILSFSVSLLTCFCYWNTLTNHVCCTNCC